MVNLAVEVRHRKTLEEHRQRLFEYTQESGDPFHVPGYDRLDS